MRKLLLLTLVLGFSSSVFAKTNDVCLIEDGYWECTIGGKLKSSSYTKTPWYKDKSVKKGTSLAIHVWVKGGSDYDPEALMLKYCDFSKTVIFKNTEYAKKYYCSRV